MSYLLHLLGIGVKHEFAWSNFLLPIYSKTFFNGPLWFLLSLYWAFLLLYLIIQICRKNEIAIIISTLIIGAIGYYINDLGITLPLFLGPAFVACPLLMAGYLIKKYLSLYLQNKKNVLIAILISFIVFILFRVVVSMQGNYYNGYYPMFIISVFCGTIVILGLSVLTESWFNIASYWGKYSLVVLCLHNFVLIPVVKTLYHFIDVPIIWSITSFIIIYLAFLVIIPVISKICPSLFNIKK